MSDNYLEKASDPHQYDSAAINWAKEGSKDSPTRLFFREYLKDNLNIEGKKVIDIGSGMGQLFPLLQQLGATYIKGVEPSVNNVEVSKKLYPDIDVFSGTIQEFSGEDKFDAAVVVMVFEHIIDVAGAFEKINKVLEANGILYLAVADKKYHMSPRFNYEMDIAENDDGSVVAKITRPYGTLYDILRPLEHYISMAQKQGFILEKSLELKPNQALTSADPKYIEFADSPIAHLLILRKENI